MIYREAFIVTKVYERTGKRRISGIGDTAVMQSFSQGWMVVLGNYLGLQFENKPDLKAGDHVMLTLEKLVDGI